MAQSAEPVAIAEVIPARPEASPPPRSPADRRYSLFKSMPRPLCWYWAFRRLARRLRSCPGVVSALADPCQYEHEPELFFWRVAFVLDDDQDGDTPGLASARWEFEHFVPGGYAESWWTTVSRFKTGADGATRLRLFYRRGDRREFGLLYELRKRGKLCHEHYPERGEATHERCRLCREEGRNR